MFLGSSIIVVGSIVQATCYNLGGFMAGRFILGFGVALCAIAGPAYISEMAHPAYRGAMTAIYNSFWFLGGIPGTFVPYGTRVIENTMAWRIPVWLQMVFSGLVLILCLFLPEVRAVAGFRSCGA
jgi:MFS family permease